MRVNTNHFELKQVFLAIAFATAFFASTGLTPVAMAAEPVRTYHPNWNQGANESYLVSTTAKADRTLNDEIFDPNASRAMRAEYEQRTDSNQAFANAGLVSTYDESSRFQVMKDFARRAMNTMSNIRMKFEGDRITNVVKNSDVPKAPLAATVLVASLYSGRSMSIHMGDTKIQTRVVLKDHVGEVGIPLAVIGATATLAYNHAGEVCAGDNGCALLSKQITPQVSAVLNSAERGSARLVYSVSF